MLFLSEDILFIEEVIENLCEKNIEAIKELKQFLDTKNIKIEEEKNITLTEFQKEIESIVLNNFSEIRLPINNSPLYYEYLVGGLLVHLIKNDDELMLKGSTSVTLWQDKYKYFIDLLGFQTILGINILGVITKMNDKTYYQYFSIKDDTIIFNKLDIDMDNNKLEVKAKIIEHIIKNNTKNYIDYDIDKLTKLINKFKDEEDTYVISVLADFTSKYLE